MTTLSERRLKTGDDPRTLADYAALRNETNKLTHPARPDVNWLLVENLSLSLFEHNGVELQTAAWYCLARTHQAGLSGLNEGLAILTTLVTHQWSSLWPQQVHARIEIFSALSKRLQQVLRARTLTSADLSQLKRMQEYLHVLDEVLQRMELTPVNQLDTLRAQIDSAAVRLEESTSGRDQPAETLTPLSDAPGKATECVKRVYVPEFKPLQAYPPRAKPWKPFAAGMASMLVLVGILAGGWLAMQQPHPSPETGIPQTQQQLAKLLQLKPDWALSDGDRLVQQTLRLWPEQSKPLAQQWQRQKAAIALAPENLNGWHEGVTQLEQLANRLNALDEQKGKYMTVSELKSAVFAILQSLNRTVPVEEQLRQLSVIPAEQEGKTVRQRQVEQHLQQLIATYSALKHSPTE